MIIKLRVRVLIGIMIFLGYFLIYLVRYNISVHIVDMSQILTKHKTMLKDGHLSISGIRNNTRNKQIKDLKNYLKLKDVYWSDIKIARLLSAYYFGYCTCFPIFHNWGDRLGPTWVVGIAGFISGVVTSLSPIAAFYSYWFYFVVRIINGFCAGAMQPSMVQLLRNWVPPIERNHFMWAYCGVTTGCFSTFIFCALVHYYSWWPIGFYAFGGAQIIWALLWIFMVCDEPKNHPCISNDELTYLKKTIGTFFTIKLTNAQIPWNLIFKSAAFWSLLVLNFGYAWIIIALCLHGPLFYAVVAEYSIYVAAILTAVPCFFRLILGTVAIQIYHWYKNKTELEKVKKIRKYIVMASHIVPGLLVVSCWIAPVAPGPIILSIAVSLTALGMDQTLELCNELSPTFANSINTVIKIIGNVPGIIIPFLVGHVTERYLDTVAVWRHVWCFHAFVLLCSGVVFLLFGSTDEQSWLAESRRHVRKVFVQPKASKLSQIIELDEIDSVNRLSQARPSSKIFPPFAWKHSR